MTGMTTLPVVSFDLSTRDLAAVPDAEFDALCRQIGREVLTPRWSSMLSHPARRTGLAAYVDGELVGVARVWHRAGDVTEVYLAVDPTRRHHGVATRLVNELTAATGDRDATLVAADGATVHHLRSRRWVTPVRVAS